MLRFHSLLNRLKIRGLAQLLSLEAYQKLNLAGTEGGGVDNFSLNCPLLSVLGRISLFFFYFISNNYSLHLFSI